MTEDRRDETSLMFSVFTVSQQVGTALTRALDGTGLGPVDYGIYGFMARLREPITPSGLAERLSIRPSTLTGYLTSMTSRGHLRRLPNPRDGRSTLVELTPEGRAAHRQAHAAAVPAHQALDDALGPSRDRVRRALLDLSAALEAVNRADSSPA